MQAYQRAFLELAVECDVLRFGEFTLKSGRKSPYFFNLGMIAGGGSLRRLASAYADALVDSGVGFDMLFGPAYKGIPLVAALATELAARGIDRPFAYNRKEAKDHGEGGVLVGAPPAGRAVIVDDVLTAGTAMAQSVTLLREAGAEPAAALIALDRAEQLDDGRSAVQRIEQDLGMRVLSLVTLDDVINFLETDASGSADLPAIRAYRAKYGVTA